MAKKLRVKVARADFEKLGQKLERLYSTLSSGEAHVFEFLMEGAAAGAGQWPPPAWITPRFRYKPRGAQMLVAGGADGLTILINSHGKITVVPPIGPLPFDRHADALGAIPIRA
ncbi:MAG TPA: hypothetical protein VEU62_24435 [Bryobacterales bacterium]|nr:hypothetical protein [Bryobacterales bacterium]